MDPAFLGVPPISDDLLRLLGLVSLALFFESYDLSMLTSALKHIAQSLAIDEREMGGYLGLIRLGALPAFLLIPIADRLGRRRLFLASIVGISVFTFLTAFAQTPWQFVALQMISRTFMVTAIGLRRGDRDGGVPGRARGWGIGMMGALAACGVGFGALLFALVDCGALRLARALRGGLASRCSCCRSSAAACARRRASTRNRDRADAAAGRAAAPAAGSGRSRPCCASTRDGRSASAAWRC